MLSVWCLVPGNYPTARRLRPLRSLIEDRTIAEKSIDLILSRYLTPKNLEDFLIFLIKIATCSVEGCILKRAPVEE